MPRGTSGLIYDLQLLRRRAWLFIPFFLIGLFVAFVLVSAAGDANAVATMQLDTNVSDAVIGGDRGLRIFEAQSMTGEQLFKDKVTTAIGGSNFDYSRFAISLNPISVADGVSRGILTVAITDATKVNAEKFRQAWVDTFVQEYTAPEGLFRARFIETKLLVAKNAEEDYLKGYAALKPIVEAKGYTLDSFLSTGADFTLPSQLSIQEAKVVSELAHVQGYVNAYAGSAPSAELAASASSVLGQPVDAANALGALNARVKGLQAALVLLRAEQSKLSDSAFDQAFQERIAELRGAAEVRNQSYIRLANARVAVRSAISHVETSYSFSGGVAGTTRGRVAVTIAFTLVFGVIAIYTLEWLSQLRRQGDS